MHERPRARPRPKSRSLHAEAADYWRRYLANEFQSERAGGNATGFMQFEYGLSGKWLELLKEIAPGLTRAIVLWDPAVTAGIGQFAIIQSVATSAGVDVRPVNARDATEIKRVITAFARSSNGGLVVTQSAPALIHRDLITA
jgi:putative tryptophan/tyrosine transport system substrate-binding protein